MLLPLAAMVFSLGMVFSQRAKTSGDEPGQQDPTSGWTLGISVATFVFTYAVFLIKDIGSDGE
jgi:hypothetical protein